MSGLSALDGLSDEPFSQGDKYDAALRRCVNEVKELSAIKDITSVTVEEFQREQQKPAFLVDWLDWLTGDTYLYAERRGGGERHNG